MNNKKPKLKHIYWEQMDKERLLYLSICPKRDRAILTYQRDMRLTDFTRISYLLSVFGFNEYAFYLENEYPELLREFGDNPQKTCYGYYNVENDVAQITRWSQEFYDELPSALLKTYIGEILGIFE